MVPPKNSSPGPLIAFSPYPTPSFLLPHPSFFIHPPPPISPMPFLLLQAIVTGDFVLARASMALARIGHAEVINVLATVIDNLVKGRCAVELRI